MADTVEARREARRRKILENSQNRLKLITGKSGDDTPTEPVIITRTIIPEVIDEIPVVTSTTSSCSMPAFNNGAIRTEPDTIEPLPNDTASGEGETLEKNPLVHKLTNYKYDIVLLSIIIQLVYCSSLFKAEDTYFFLPVVIYSITKLIWFPSPSNSRIGSALRLLQGFSSYQVQKLITVATSIGVISCDICIFLFTTICMQSFYFTLTDGLWT